MKIIDRSKLPKRDYCPAAECRQDFDAVAAMLKAKPSGGIFDDDLVPPKKYREVCVELSTGRCATLTQTEMRRSVIEIGLEVEDDQFFHEEDLLEVVSGLGRDLEFVKKFVNEFTWVKK